MLAQEFFLSPDLCSESLHNQQGQGHPSPNDWPLVALALHLGGAPILTLDGDFLGCGLPTWTPDTLRMHLGL